ncbi:MAG TPA: energy-coupling factor transporter transmembrane component T [Sphaerochaeta sp.]|nr:energy-coupling factor transporter transmembrane component T [Sphaerochaeta sp.]HPY45630.1 energy-coupling factor transporter transmembrane component T [Sphaerochaeta sp.]HQB04861.1 energy-coupling factor transporter transmembrane component T [Sphaerochaeta sp.]
MARRVIFSYRHQDRLLNRTHPFVKVLALLCGCILLIDASVLLVSTIALFLLLLTGIQRLPLRSYARQLRFFILLFTLIALSECLRSRSVRLALIVLVRYALMILYALLITDSTSSDEIASSIPLVNKSVLAGGIELTLAIVPTIFQVSEEIRIAQRARLRRWSIKGTFEYLSTLFELLLIRLEERALALEGRLFDAKRKRHAPPLSLYDLPMVLATAFFIGLRMFGYE